MTGVCARCGAIGRIEQHHPTCRRLDRSYFHPNFRVPFCQACHDGAHILLRAEGIEKTVVDSDGLILARVVAFIAWMGMVDRPDSLNVQIAMQVATVLTVPLKNLLANEAAVREGAHHG
jgi:hypothetical protein